MNSVALAVSRENPEILKLLDHCQIKDLPAKQVIIRPGDPADTMYYIIDGSATITMTDDEGNDIILGYLNTGDFIGETGLFIRQQKREVTVRTRTACKVGEISYIKLEALAQDSLHEQYVGILFALGIHISKRLMQANRKVGHLAFMDVSGRIASALLDLCKQPDAMTHPDGMQIKVSRTELGRIVGCSREMVGRVIKGMEEQGLISAHGKTIVVFGAR